MVTTGQYGYFWLQLSDDYDGLDSKNLSYLSGVWRGKERRRKEGYIKDDWMMIGWGMNKYNEWIWNMNEYTITIWIGTLNE